MERDDVSSRTMVLCVSSVSVSDNETESVARETNDGETDGRGNAKKNEVSFANSFYRAAFPSSVERNLDFFLSWFRFIMPFVCVSVHCPRAGPLTMVCSPSCRLAIFCDMLVLFSF